MGKVQRARLLRKILIARGCRRRPRFLCAISHEKKLKMWKEKYLKCLDKANAIMNASMLCLQLPRTPTIPRTSPTTLVGLDQRKKDVLKLLRLEEKEEIIVVVLHGMGGVGKSTLGEAVYKEASMSIRASKRRCRIEVGENPTATHITSSQRKMVEDLTGESLQNQDKAAIEEKLRRVLMNKSGEPVFIYVDNVLQTEDLEKLINLDCELMEIPEGSRLLVTTRDMSVCSRVLRRNRHFEVREFSVKVLNDEDARRLFFKHAFGEEEPSAELVEKYDGGQGLIESMVSSVCGNLPLALRVLGRSLTGEAVNVWRSKCRELMSFGDSEFERKVTNVLESSFNALDPETQTAFLIACVCFCDCNLEHFTDVVTSLLPKAAHTRLLELGLLEARSDGHFFYVKMHDLVRNLGFQLAVQRKCAYRKTLTNKEDFGNVKEEAAWREVKWLRVSALEEGIETELIEKCEELEVLVLLDTHVNGHIGEPPQHLKVVICDNNSSRLSIELDKLKELAVWITDLAYLREDFLVTPPKRSTLQVFSGFQGPHISEEAVDCHKNTLRKLICQGIVELSSYFCKNMARLQELTLYDYGGDSFPKEMGSLVGLEYLQLTSSTIREFPPADQTLVHLKRLRWLYLELENLMEFPCGVLGAGMTELGVLQLHLESVKSMPAMQDIGQLVSLEVLQLSLPSAKCIAEDDGVICDLIKLEKLKYFKLNAGSMSSLEGVCLSCPSLESVVLNLGDQLQVLPSRFITGATKLQSVALWDCECLQELPAAGNTSDQLLGPALESLVVVSCPALKALPEGLMNMERLAVVGCGGMERLPGDLVERAGGMRQLLCDARLLPPHLLPLPHVLPFTPGTGVNDLQRWLTTYVEDDYKFVSRYHA